MSISLLSYFFEYFYEYFFEQFDFEHFFEYFFEYFFELIFEAQRLMKPTSHSHSGCAFTGWMDGWDEFDLQAGASKEHPTVRC